MREKVTGKLVRKTRRGWVRNMGVVEWWDGEV